jgi:drug/metabolite transporter (DMT)-like permease
MSSPSRQDLGFLHLAVLLFGLAGLFGKAIGGGAWAIVAGRTVFAALALCLFSLLSRTPLKVTRRDWPRFFLSGFLLATHWWTFFYAIQVSSVAIGLLGFAAFPVFVSVLEPLVTGERGGHGDHGMIVLVTAGLLLVVPEYRLASAATLGLLWAVLSGLLFALLTLANRKLAGYGPVRLALWQNAVAALLLAPLGWPLLAQASGADWERLAVLGVAFTALAHGLFIASLRSVPARLAAVVAALEPVYGIAFAWLLFAEWPPTRTLMGGAVILLTTSWASLRKA